MYALVVVRKGTSSVSWLVVDTVLNVTTTAITGLETGGEYAVSEA